MTDSTLQTSNVQDKLDKTEGFKLSSHNTSENPYISKYGGKSGQLAGETNEIERDPGKKDSSSQRITSFQHPNESINELEASKLKYSRSTPSTSSTSNSSSSCNCLSCEDVQKELGIVRSMYMMNLDEDVSSDEKMNTTDEANLDVSKGDGTTIDFTYRGAHISGEETTDNNVRLETPVSNNTMNRSGTDKLYKLEEQDKKRAKEEKKAKKKKEKKEKKSKKHKNKNKNEEDEIIVANEEQAEDGNDYPTMPASNQSYQNAYLEKGAPYFMATSETMGKHNQFEIVTEADQHGTAKSYGKHTIPRPNVQQNYARSSKKEDENHLIFRREDEKENDTETTGTGDDGEAWPQKPQRYPSPERHYQEPYRGQAYVQHVQRPPLPLPPSNLQLQQATLQRTAGSNMDQGGPFYASVATLQRDRTNGMALIRADKDGPIFYENPYGAMPQNKNINRIAVKDGRIVQDANVGYDYGGIRAPPPPPPSAIYGSNYAYPPKTMKNKSKKKKKNEPPTWKEIRDAYLKSQVPDEDRMQKYSPNRHLEGIAMAIGFIGMIVAVSLLLAYVIVQAPQLRRKIGPSLYIPPGESLEFDTNDTKTSTLPDTRENRGLELPPESTNANRDNIEKSDTKGESGPNSQKPYVIYGVEIGVSIFAGIMMITTNALLIHGVRKKYGSFLLPWLVFHAFFVAALFAAMALIIKYVTPKAYKSIAVLPGVAGLLLILCWIKVFKLRKNFNRQHKRRCGKVEDLYGTGNASTYMNFGDNLYNPAPKIPDPDYSMG